MVAGPGFFAWAVCLGPKCDLEFALDCKVVRHELRRLVN